MSKFFLSAAVAVALVPVAVLAHPPSTPILAVAHTYARSTNPDVGAVFMTIYNETPADCTLTNVTVEGFGRAELHTHTEENGVMKMGKIDAIAVPTKTAHELARGGDHIMLMEPAAPIAQGQKIDGALDFGSCGSVPFSTTIDNNAGPEAKPEAAGEAAGHHKDSH